MKPFKRLSIAMRRARVSQKFSKYRKVGKSKGCSRGRKDLLTYKLATYFARLTM